jgi:hypothetical protein
MAVFSGPAQDNHRTSRRPSFGQTRRLDRSDGIIEKLAAMRLLGMAEALKGQEQGPSARELSFLDRFGLLVDQQWNWRENQALSRRLKNAKPNA